MLDTEQSRQQIIKHCVDILYKNPQLFSVSHVAHNFASNFNELQRESYIKSFLKKSVGLEYIVKLKTNNISEIWWTLPFNTYNTIINGVIESILLEYANSSPDMTDRDAWKQMLKKESLNKKLVN